MDALVEHLLADIAVEGEQGMTLPALEASLLAFEEARAVASARPAQKVDEAYTNYVWRQLRQRRDVRVGAAVAPEQQARAMQANGTLRGNMLDVTLPDSVASAGAAAAPPPPPPPNKNKRQDRPPVIIGTVDVDQTGTTLDIAALKAQHGDALRFTLEGDSLRTRLWGSVTCPPLTWGTVQLAMRAREHGITFQEVGRLIHGGVAVMDSKTVFHHYKAPLAKGLVLKYSTTISKKSTDKSKDLTSSGSAVVASRFKEQCAPYLAATQGNSMAAPRTARASNEGEDEDAQGGADEEGTETTDVMELLAAEPHKLGKNERERVEAEPEEDAEDAAEEDADVKGSIGAEAPAAVVHDEGVEGVMGYAPLTPALQTLLISRHDLLRQRIARLCEVSTGGLLLRSRLRPRLGLAYGKPIRRAVGAAWRLLVNKGLLELVNVRIKKKDEDEDEEPDKAMQRKVAVAEVCLRLTPAGEAWLADERRGADERANEKIVKRLAADLERHRKRSIAIEVPLERQVIECVCAAGMRGTTLMELKKHLGMASYAKQRSLASVLVQLQVRGQTPAYDDTTLVCASDKGSGRTKEMRYWSRPAHLALMRQATFGDDAVETYAAAQALHEFTDATPVQEWTNVADRDAAIRALQAAALWHGGKPGSKKQKKKRVNPIDPLTGEVKRGRPRKAAADKASTTRGSAEKQAKKDARAAAKAAKAAAGPKKRGRPKKVPDPNVPPPEPKKKGRPRKADSELSHSALVRRRRQEKAAAAAAGEGLKEEQDDDDDAASTAAVQALLQRDEASPAGPSTAGPSREAAPVEPPAAPVADEEPGEEETVEAAHAPPPAKRSTRARTDEQPQERQKKRARRSKQVEAAGSDDAPQATGTSSAQNDVEMPPIEAPSQPAEAAASLDAGPPEQPGAAASSAANVEPAPEPSPAPSTPRAVSARPRKSQPPAPANYAKRRRALLLAEFLKKHKFVLAPRAAAELQAFLIERGEDDVNMFDDTKTRRQTFEYLQERGTAKSITTAVKSEAHYGRSGQQVIYYHVDTSDDDLAKFAKQMSSKGPGARVRVLDEDVEELDRPVGMPARERQVDPFYRATCEELLSDPKYRKYFEEDAMTRSQPQGYVPGGMARLQMLHEAVMNIFEADNSVEDGEASDDALVSHADGIIDVEKLRLDSLSAAELLKLVPSEPSPELAAVVESADKKARTATQLGGEVEELARRDSSREAFDALLRDLQLLDLAQPVRMRKGKVLPADRPSKLWQFKRDARRFVGYCRETRAPMLLPTPRSFGTVQEALDFWKLVRGRSGEADEAYVAAEDADDAEIEDFQKRHRMNHAWSRSYYISPLQKRFLSRFAEEMLAEILPEQLVRSVAEITHVPLPFVVRFYLHKLKMSLHKSHPLSLFNPGVSERAKDGDASASASASAAAAAAKQSRAVLLRQREERRKRGEQWDAAVAKCLADAGILPEHPQHELLTLTLQDTSMRRSWVKGTEDVQLGALAGIISNAKEAPVVVKGEGAARRLSEAQAKAARKHAERAVRQAEAKAAKASAGGKRKRVVRSNVAWTPARDDQLRDAVAVIRVRDAERGKNPKGREQMTALLQLFPDHQMQNLSSRLRILGNMVGEEAYMEELQAQWAKESKLLRSIGELQDGDWSSPDAFDLPRHVKLLQDTVAKEEVHRNIEQCPAEPLPIDTAPLRKELLEDKRMPHDLPETAWDAATTHDIAASAVVRTRFLKGQSFTLRRAAPEAAPISVAQGVARAIVRMHLDMDDDDKKGLSAGMETMAAAFGGGIDKAIDDLVTAKQIRLERAPTDGTDLSTMRARRPGSNYVWCAEASASNPFGELDFAAVARAQAQAERKPLTEVRPDLDDNEAAALVLLLSEHRLAPAALDLKQLRIATRGRFNAKLMTDKELELLLPLAPVVKPEPGEHDHESSEPPEHAVLAWCADGEEDWADVSQRISKAWSDAARKARRDGTLVERLARLLEDCGEAGATRNEIEAAFAGVSQAQMQRVMRVPLHANPPLAFFAGYDEPRLVHAQHLQAWTVRALSDEAAMATPAPEPEKTASGRKKRKKSTPRPTDVPTEAASRTADAAAANLLARARTLGARFFPRVWLNLRGERSDKGRWQQGVRSVVTTVLERPGVPLTHLVSLFAQASRTGLAYDRLEVSELLAAACATGVLAQHIVRPDGLRSAALGDAPEGLFLAPHDSLCLFPTGRDWSLWAAGGLQ